MVLYVISPKNIPKHARVKNICIASVYISPKSRFKRQTIAHIVESIQVIRSYYANEIYIWISGNFNKFPYEDILRLPWKLTKYTKRANKKRRSFKPHYNRPSYTVFTLSYPTPLRCG